MHYIRLLRPPTVELERGVRTLKVTFTITTDLGDSFFSPMSPVPIAVFGTNTGDTTEVRSLVPINLTATRPAAWRGGLRVLKLDLPMPVQPITTLQIRPVSKSLAAFSTDDIYGNAYGLIMPVYVDLPTPGADTEGDAAPRHVAFRSIRLASQVASLEDMVQVEEDLGDSIARHIWDGGVATVALLAHLCLRERESRRMPRLSALLQRRHPLAVLELGCGIGILGVGVAHVLKSLPGAGPTRVLMTDLPDAEPRASANIARFRAQTRDAGFTNVELGYENLDWEDGRRGEFSETVRATPWDLIIVSECVYNTDTLPALVQTLTGLHKLAASHRGVEAVSPHKPICSVLLSTKPRHDSEDRFWALMRLEGWRISDNTELPLPMLGGEKQLVKVVLFQK